MTFYCAICGVECKDTYEYEARKGKNYIVCSICFRRYVDTPFKEVRKLINSSLLSSKSTKLNKTKHLNSKISKK